MPWSTPSLRDVRKLVRDQIAGTLPGADASVPNSVLRIMADAKAAVAHLTLLYLDWLALQFLPDTAETEWLDRHGNIWLGGRKAATFAVGQATFSGAFGVKIPQATRLVGNNGFEYETTAYGVVGDLPVNIPIRALTPGFGGNLEVGSTLSLVTAIDGLDPGISVIELTGGTDAESDDSLRERVLFRIRKPPMGGDADDYILWSRAFAGVSRAWSYPLEMGIGTVTVRFMMDEARSNLDGFPTQEDCDNLHAYLDTVRPVAVKEFFVVAPIPFPISFTISGLVKDDAATHAAIEASVIDMLADKGKPGQTIYRSWIDEAISQASGEDEHELTFTTTPMPSPGHLPVLGNIIYA